MRYSFSARMLLPLPVAAACFLLNACAVVSKPPLRELTERREEKHAEENINGSFPDAVYVKTRTQTFNAYHYYFLHGGLIWYKSIDPSKEPADWTLFEKTGLPHNSRKPDFAKTGAVVEISADADELVALSEEGGFYRYCFDKSIAHKNNTWLDRSGWPVEEQLCLDRRTAANTAWAMGKRNLQVLYYEDPFGNQHHNGTMEIVTFYILLEDGQEICYADTGLPGYFSRNFLGPERGTFKSAALSASASTLFLLNEAGEMYTRIADFDIVGSDPMFFKYTYVPYTSNVPGTDYFSNLTEWGLPPEDWRLQPPIPLAGKAALTRHITILQNGQGNGARELRVAGLNETGETGYWAKAIFADAWEFKTVPLYFSPKAFLRAATDSPGIRGERGLSHDTGLRGSWWNGNQKEDEWEYAIPNFNILEGSCDFRITWQGETCVLQLHPVELWTYLKRDYQPGRTGPPKMFFGTLVIPDNAFAGLSEAFTAQLQAKFGKNDQSLFHYIITASSHYLMMRETDNPDSLLLLTDGSISAHLPQFRQRWLVDNFEEMRRYNSPELVFAGRTALARDDYRELMRKIELNTSFRDELRQRINEMNESKFTAFRVNAAYLPMDYFSRITFLNLIDVPKIRTITRFGERIVLTNAAYIDVIATTRIGLCERIINHLETRIRCYTDMAQELAKGAKEVSFPPWFAESVAEYWSSAGLPQNVTGVFFSPAGVLQDVQIPATISLNTAEMEQGLFGWYFNVAENAAAAGEKRTPLFFIDPRKSAKTIYSRKGKTPEQRTLRLRCTLYLNADALNDDASIIKKDVIERSLKPFVGAMREGMDVLIVFDGNTFEIKEYPATHSRQIIFRGKVK